jgi:hypothetical protein
MIRIDHLNHIRAEFFKHVTRHHHVFAAGAENSRHMNAVCRGQLGQRRQRRQPNTTPQHHDILPARVEMKSDAQRTGDIEIISGLQQRHALGAAPFALIQELKMTGVLIHAVDAHGAAHPDFGSIGRRTQQMKELPGLGRQCTGRRFQQQQFIFAIDPFIGQHIADEFTSGTVGMTIRFADTVGGGGIFGGGNKVAHGLVRLSAIIGMRFYSMVLCKNKYLFQKYYNLMSTSFTEQQGDIDAMMGISSPK